MTKEIKIDLSKENINKRAKIEKEELEVWLRKKGSSLEKISSDEKILMMLAVMGIEIDTAMSYSRQGELDITGQILANAKRTKDDIYGELMKAHHMIGEKGEILSLGIGENYIGLWKDYIMEKFEGGTRQCEFALTNCTFY